MLVVVDGARGGTRWSLWAPRLEHGYDPWARPPLLRSPAPKWRLVGDITPAWRTVSGLGYGQVLSSPVRLRPRVTPTTFSGPSRRRPPVSQATRAPTATSRSLTTAATAGSNRTCRSPCPTPPSRLRGRRTCATLGIDPSGNATFLETNDGGAPGSRWPVRTSHFVHRRHGSRLHHCRVLRRCRFRPGRPVRSCCGLRHQRRRRHVDRLCPANRLRADRASVRVGRALYRERLSQSPDGSSTIPPGTVLYSSDDGATWAAASVPPGLGPLGRVSCPDSTDCVASFFGDDGSSSQILASTDGGQSWSEAAASLASSVRDRTLLPHCSGVLGGWHDPRRLRRTGWLGRADHGQTRSWCRRHRGVELR